MTLARRRAFQGQRKVCMAYSHTDPIVAKIVGMDKTNVLNISFIRYRKADFTDATRRY